MNEIDKNYSRFNRGELMALLIAQTKENERLREELDAARAKIAERRAIIDKAGSIAEVSAELSGIFAAAEEACAVYTENIKLLSGREEEILAGLKAEAERYAKEREEEAESYAERVRREADEYAGQERAKAEAYMDRAKKEADNYWQDASTKVLELLERTSGGA